MKILKKKISMQLKSLSNVKILDESKLKAFSDDKLRLVAKMKCVFGRVENLIFSQTGLKKPFN